VVFGEAATPERLAARALEIEAGRVHEHQVERAEDIAPPREQLLLQDVMLAARREPKPGGAGFEVRVSDSASHGRARFLCVPISCPISVDERRRTRKVAYGLFYKGFKA
jgi:hypothetical protein